MLISLLKGSYNIKIPIKTNNNEGLLSTRQNELITINKTRTRKADKNFWKRTSYLLNIIRKVGNVDLDQIDKRERESLGFCGSFHMGLHPSYND